MEALDVTLRVVKYGPLWERNERGEWTKDGEPAESEQMIQLDHALGYATEILDDGGRS